MTTQTEALNIALDYMNERLEDHDYKYQRHPATEAERINILADIETVKEALAQPEQKQNLKLMPREATPEMLKAMDECSTEGYDERLYEGHAGSVYMAAWDAFHGQHCYCGDITNLGVIHRDDGPCHYSEHTSEYKRGYADAMNWKMQNHLEHLPAAQPKQEPVAWGFQNSAITGSNRWMMLREEIPANDQYGGALWTPLYTTPPPLTESHKRKPLTDAQLEKGRDQTFSINNPFCPCDSKTFRKVARWVEAAHDIKG